MEEEVQLKIEEAKSWFVLAQILIILAGFMFATSGIYHNNLKQTEKMMEDLFFQVSNSGKFTINENDSYSQFIMNYQNNLGDDERKFQIKIMEYKKWGEMLIMVSLILWLIGYYKFSKRIKHLMNWFKIKSKLISHKTKK
ncbi:MAG: hypothetical protein WC812_03430 [Candidatus Pacearchaeota archaeon]|jgi:hypothetical protein